MLESSVSTFEKKTNKTDCVLEIYTKQLRGKKMCDFWVYMPSKVLDVSEQFGPSETSTREIVRSELHLSVSTVNRVDTIRLRKVSIVHSMESKMTNPVPSTVVNPMPSATATQIKVDPSTEKLINVKDQIHIGETISQSKSEKTFMSWIPILTLKSCSWIKT